MKHLLLFFYTKWERVSQDLLKLSLHKGGGFSRKYVNYLQSLCRASCTTHLRLFIEETSTAAGKLIPYAIIYICMLQRIL